MTDSRKKTDGRVVLIWVLAFFLTFMTVDAFFVYKALDTYPGIVDLTDGK